MSIQFSTYPKLLSSHVRQNPFLLFLQYIYKCIYNVWDGMKPTGPLVNSSSVQNKHEEVAFSFVSLKHKLKNILFFSTHHVFELQFFKVWCKD